MVCVYVEDVIENLPVQHLWEGGWGKKKSEVDVIFKFTFEERIHINEFVNMWIQLFWWNSFIFNEGGTEMA